ncbi:hypothetical protein RGQ29_024625 [Quercus rubra]|uniref:Uncharacterized protein n=1 Tax=Quercus rubra TaxID=3512 RepID=A0AAN7EW01_QUERU|nr:hypothetical protein RGQ29_024625 [Quercus rubra]
MNQEAQAGQAFVSAALAETEVEESRGSFVVKMEMFICMKKKKKQFHKAGISADIQFETKETSTSARYWLLFDQKNSNQIGFQMMLGEPGFKQSHKTSPTPTGRYRGFRRRLGQIRKRKLGFLSRPRGYVTVSSAEEEIQEMKVAESTKFNREQGIGRGDQPITFAANLVSYRAGGDWSTTYAPSPFYMTSKMRSLYLEGYDYSVFDLTRNDRVQIQIHGTSVQGRILHGNSPSELVEHFTETIGRPPVLPEWIISGAVVGMQGGTETVRDTWDKLRTYNVPVSAFWLQDWVGQRETLIGSQLWWNWEVDTERYCGWQQLVQDLNAQHIKVMTYCNPCLAPTHEKPNRRRNLFEEAIKLDILVKDKHGQPYMVPNTAFDVGMMDLTHPNTASWFKQILQEMVDDGVRGWMADFGEGLPVDATLYSGEDPISAHNRYPELWAQINREFVEEWKSKCVGKGKEDPEEALVFFMRAGFRNSPNGGCYFGKETKCDIGGYCAVNLPFINYTRSEELAFALDGAKCFHHWEQANPAIANSTQTTKLYHNLLALLKCTKHGSCTEFNSVKEAAQKGPASLPHLFLHYPEDEHVHHLSYQQFLVGTEILVVPVLDKGKKNVKAIFQWEKVPIGNISGQGSYLQNKV